MGGSGRRDSRLDTEGTRGTLVLGLLEKAKPGNPGGKFIGGKEKERPADTGGGGAVKRLGLNWLVAAREEPANVMTDMKSSSL